MVQCFDGASFHAVHPMNADTDSVMIDLLGLVHSTRTELNPVRKFQCEQPHLNICVENQPSTSRRSFAAADR